MAWTAVCIDGRCCTSPYDNNNNNNNGGKWEKNIWFMPLMICQALMTMTVGSQCAKVYASNIFAVIVEAQSTVDSLPPTFRAFRAIVVPDLLVEIGMPEIRVQNDKDNVVLQWHFLVKAREFGQIIQTPFAQ
jgi:hypothetical protein